MSPDAPRWPYLKLRYHPLLDWVGVEYTKVKLLEIADAVSKNPHPIQMRTTTGQPGVWDPAIETLLRTLASKPKALEALNHHRDTPGRDVVGLNRAVHFHVRVALGDKPMAAYDLVATAWGGKKTSIVRADVLRFRMKKPGEYLERDAVRLTEQLVAIARHKNSCTRPRALRIISDDLWDRAQAYRVKAAKKF